MTVLGGIAFGVLAGLIFAELMKRTEDPLLDIALTTIVAYGTYIVAEVVLHGLVSPVIAVVAAGITVGSVGTNGRRMSATSNNMIVTFWDFSAFSINSAIFLLIGLEFSIQNFVDQLGPILLTIVVVLAARAVVVYLIRQLNRRGTPMPRSWAHVMFWGGMRGAVSIALALSLSPLIESRELLITLPFGYVFFSVVFQGLSISPLLRKLGLTRRTDQQIEFEHQLGRVGGRRSRPSRPSTACMISTSWPNGRPTGLGAFTRIGSRNIRMTCTS